MLFYELFILVCVHAGHQFLFGHQFHFKVLQIERVAVPRHKRLEFDGVA